jgi:hypothetical protein
MRVAGIMSSAQFSWRPAARRIESDVHFTEYVQTNIIPGRLSTEHVVPAGTKLDLVHTKGWQRCRKHFGFMRPKNTKANGAATLMSYVHSRQEQAPKPWRTDEVSKASRLTASGTSRSGTGLLTLQVSEPSLLTSG